MEEREIVGYKPAVKGRLKEKLFGCIRISSRGDRFNAVTRVTCSAPIDDEVDIYLPNDESGSGLPKYFGKALIELASCATCVVAGCKLREKMEEKVGRSVI